MPDELPLRDLDLRWATVDDADAIVPLIVSSSEEMLAHSFSAGRWDAAALVRGDFLRRRGLFGADHQLVATLGGAIVATTTAYPGRDFSRLSLATFATVCSLYDARALMTIARRGHEVAPLFSPPSPGAIFIANVCVDAAMRGQGIAARLLEHAIAALGSQATFSAVELDVAADNPRAQRLYERLGFAVTFERAPRPSSRFAPTRRMVRAL